MRFSDYSYEGLFGCIYPNCCQFTCRADSKFMQSLSDAGYDDWRRTQVASTIKDIKNSAGLTSVWSSGYIYYEAKDCYFEISTQRVELTTFKISVCYCPNLYTENDVGAVTTSIVSCSR